MARSRKPAAVSKTPGTRVGTKRRDMRWRAPDGTEWDSRFEYEVFLAYTAAGFQTRKATEQDCVTYSRPVRNGVCRKCGALEVATQHRYTPDLFVIPPHAGKRGGMAQLGPFSLEVKGYLRAERRSLLRALCKAQPNLHLRLLVQRDYQVTKSLSLTEWARKFLHIPVAVWTGQPPSPAEWR